MFCVQGSAPGAVSIVEGGAVRLIIMCEFREHVMGFIRYKCALRDCWVAVDILISRYPLGRAPRPRVAAKSSFSVDCSNSESNPSILGTKRLCAYPLWTCFACADLSVVEGLVWCDFPYRRYVFPVVGGVCAPQVSARLVVAAVTIGLCIVLIVNAI